MGSWASCSIYYHACMGSLFKRVDALWKNRFDRHTFHNGNVRSEESVIRALKELKGIHGQSMKLG